jgi:hypothetical protein
MASKQVYLLWLLGILVNGSAHAQQTPRPPLDSGAATIKCHDQPYVSVTADPEQAVPLQVVASVNCDEEVTILSDTQGYTVKIRTASGRIGYVARFEVALDSMKQEAVVMKSTSAETNVQGPGAEPTPVESHLDEQDDHSKPRIYVSDTDSWAASGGFGNPSSVAPGSLYGGYNPEMVDIYQDFTSDCPAAVVTQQKAKADYAVLFDKQSSKKGITGLGGLVKVNKVVVLSRTGETLLSQTSHSVDTAIRSACDAIAQRSGSPR